MKRPRDQRQRLLARLLGDALFRGGVDGVEEPQSPRPRVGVSGNLRPGTHERVRAEEAKFGRSVRPKRLPVARRGRLFRRSRRVREARGEVCLDARVAGALGDGARKVETREAHVERGPPLDPGRFVHGAPPPEAEPQQGAAQALALVFPPGLARRRRVRTLGGVFRASVGGSGRSHSQMMSASSVAAEVHLAVLLVPRLELGQDGEPRVELRGVAP
jgi:hypothetical protein